MSASSKTVSKVALIKTLKTEVAISQLKPLAHKKKDLSQTLMLDIFLAADNKVKSLVLVMDNAKLVCDSSIPRYIGTPIPNRFTHPSMTEPNRLFGRELPSFTYRSADDIFHVDCVPHEKGIQLNFTTTEKHLEESAGNKLKRKAKIRLYLSVINNYIRVCETDFAIYREPDSPVLHMFKNSGVKLEGQEQEYIYLYKVGDHILKRTLVLIDPNMLAQLLANKISFSDFKADNIRKAIEL